MTESDDAVVDDRERRSFLYVEDGAEAQLRYAVRGNKLILAHTEVPDQIGGRGIGGRLVRAAVARAARTGETVVPWCPFVRFWLEKHSEVAATVTIDWSPPPVE